MPRMPNIKMTDVFEQAPARIKETLALARALVNDRFPKDPMEQTNQKILRSLRKLGVATRAEVEELEERVSWLESELRKRHSS